MRAQHVRFCGKLLMCSRKFITVITFIRPKKKKRQTNKQKNPREISMQIKKLEKSKSKAQRNWKSIKICKINKTQKQSIK